MPAFPGSQTPATVFFNGLLGHTGMRKFPLNLGQGNKSTSCDSAFYIDFCVEFRPGTLLGSILHDCLALGGDKQQAARIQIECAMARSRKDIATVITTEVAKLSNNATHLQRFILNSRELKKTRDAKRRVLQ